MSAVNVGAATNSTHPRDLSASQDRRLQVLIDQVANALLLTAERRADLHAFKEFVADLDPAHWRVTVVQQATILKALDMLEEAVKANTGMKDEVRQVRTQMTKGFSVNKDMNEEILAQCKSCILYEMRDQYDLADEVLTALKDKEKYPRFAEVWSSASRTKTVLSAVRTQASYVRREFRALLVNSVTNPAKKCSLTDCVNGYLRKFCRTVDLAPELILWIAILREFVRSNRDLVSLPDDSEPSGQENSTSQAQSANTRKRPRNAGGRPSKTFWGEFSYWVKDQKQAWGKNMRSAEWTAQVPLRCRYLVYLLTSGVSTSHLDDCLAQERRDFPDDTLSLIPQRYALAAVTPPRTTTTTPSQSGPGLASGDIDISFASPPLAEPLEQPVHSRVGSALHTRETSLTPSIDGRGSYVLLNEGTLGTASPSTARPRGIPCPRPAYRAQSVALTEEPVDTSLAMGRGLQRSVLPGFSMLLGNAPATTPRDSHRQAPSHLASEGPSSSPSASIHPTSHVDSPHSLPHSLHASVLQYQRHAPPSSSGPPSFTSVPHGSTLHGTFQFQSNSTSSSSYGY